MDPATPATLEYIFPEGPPHGEPREICPGVYWLRLTLPYDLDHINVWLLDDGDSWTLVDTGIATEQTRNVWVPLLADTFRRKAIGRILITHVHPDHVGLADWLARHFSCPVYMSKDSRILFDAFMGAETAALNDAVARFSHRHGVTELEEYRRFSTGEQFRQVISGIPPDIRFIEADTAIRIGERLWTPLLCGGHAEGHAVFHCHELGLVITGDQVLPTISSNVSIHAHGTRSPNPLRDFLESLDRLAGLPAEVTVMPSHGKLFRGLHARLDALRGHHQEALERLLDLCDQPLTAGQLVPRFYRRELQGLHYSLGLGETLAHLEYLRLGGLLATELRDRRCLYYRS